MGNGLRVYVMAIKDARQRNVSNRAISMGKQHTDCPTILQYYQKWFSVTVIKRNIVQDNGSSPIGDAY